MSTTRHLAVCCQFFVFEFIFHENKGNSCFFKMVNNLNDSFKFVKWFLYIVNVENVWEECNYCMVCVYTIQ